MALHRREFLLFLGAALGATACGTFASPLKRSTNLAKLIGFQPIKGSIPLAVNALASDHQMKEYATYEVVDDLVLPDGFTYDVIATWGDLIGDSRFGYNNDYIAFFPTGKNEGLLSVNFEYISAIPWQQTFVEVIGKSLPLADVQQAIKKLKTASQSGLNAFALAKDDPLKKQVETICREALIDQGVGIFAIRRMSDGQWQRVPASAERRITGMSGLEDGRYLKATGPAVAVFRKTQGQGYLDQLGNQIIGTFQNCAGGQTPWGTVLSAEENIQMQVPEAVYADGTSFHPSDRPFNITPEELVGLGNVFGLAGNKYGWIVEIDPANPQDYGTKHTWMGRYRHEAVGVRVEPGKPLAFYSGCDRRGGHIYKFVSKGIVNNPTDKANSKLLEDGMLYAAQFQPDGSGRWIPLTMSTQVNPQSPTNLSGGMLPLPQRPQGGVFNATSNEAIQTFKQTYQTLGDLYQGTDEEKQGAILIDAHYAANAVGATCTARPEDTEIAPDGSLYIAFTSGGISQQDGSPDSRIFKGPDDNTAYEYGWIMQIMEDDHAPEAKKFRWRILTIGGEPAAGGGGFANPDNLMFDAQGNLWMVTDMSSDRMNQPIPPGRRDKNGEPISQSSLRGVYGNNAIWYIPLTGEAAGQVFLFGLGPMDCEITGPCFAPNQQALFLAIQHPGETIGKRKEMAFEDRVIAIRTTEGHEFTQTRKVPIGSNWPGKQANDPPKPSLVVVRRIQQPAFLSL